MFNSFCFRCNGIIVKTQYSVTDDLKALDTFVAFKDQYSHMLYSNTICTK